LNSVGNRFLLPLLGVAAALVLIAPATAAAAGEPNISLEKLAPTQALIGTQQSISLVAKNPLGEPRGYNLTFRDVLPKGVAYVQGSASSAPRVLENAPGPEETTLLFENVADLSANSEYVLSYKVEPSPTFFKISGKHSYSNHAEDFVSRKPRKKPTFEPNGVIKPGTFKGNSEADATTELTAVEIKKSEPSPEGEILRGVHEHQTVYTLTILNNHIGPTSGIEVEDWLPAGLEFLGCGTVDNTTDTKTNPGSAEEYPGSGPINPGNAPAGFETAECEAHLPYYVKTEEAEPPGKPKGIYTHVKWKDLGELPQSGELKLHYVAAIPILQNVPTWLGAEPAAEGLGQVANLANNTGPETLDEEPLVNVAQVKGKYEAVEVKDTDEMLRTAEDLAIQKSVTPSKIEQGEESTWTFDVESSEYRFVNGVEIDDALPNGLCPLGKENYEGPEGGVIEPLAECDPVVGVGPTYEIVGSGEGKKPAEYTSVEEQPDGTFKIHWDDTTVPGALTQMRPSEHLVIRFPTRTRTHYQENFKAAKPVLTGDSWTNKVHTQGDDFARCAPADPLCTLGGSKIYTEEAEGTPDIDDSEASQEAGGVTIDKTVRENVGPREKGVSTVPVNCVGPKTEYVQGLVSAEEPKLPLYAPGDEICWTLRVNFAAKLFAGHPIVSDFIPTDEEYVPGSAFAVEAPMFPGGENSIVSTFTEEVEGEKESLQWELGEAVPSENQVFEWRFRTKVKKGAENSPQDITGNLMKFVYSNTAGQTFPLRDRAEIEREEPELTLGKGITEVNGAPVPGAPSVEATANGGDKVTYQLDVKNEGNLAARETEVWDVLPEGITCGDVSAITAGGVCTAGKIVWAGLAVPVGGTTSLTYQVEVPVDVAPGHVFTNQTGVTHYKSLTNTGGEFEYVPSENINPKAGEPNTKPIGAEANLTTAAAALEKTATTETTQGGNGAKEATIGEIVDYQVKTTIPAGSTLYGKPLLTDELPANLEFLGTTEATLDGVALPTKGLTLEEALANGFTVQFPTTYENASGSGDDALVVKFKARVKNVAANVRGTIATNIAGFKFEDKKAGGATNLTAQAQTLVVEPALAVGKSQSTAPTKIVKPGDTIEYTVTATDGAGPGVSAANEVELVDTIPLGTEVEPASVTASGGTVVGETIVWKLGTIEPGATVSKTYKLKIKEPATAASSFTNEVVGTTQSLPDEAGVPPVGTREATFVEGAYSAADAGYESSAKETVRLIGATVSKEVAPTEGTIGTGLTYTLHMNLPPSINFFDTTVVDTLPNGVKFDEAVSAECVKGCGTPVEGKFLPVREGAGGTTLLGWYFGKLAAGAERELVVKFKAHIADKKNGGAEVKAPEALTNSVVGLYNEKEGPEPTEVPTPGKGNNSFSEETPAATAATKVLEPKVTLTKGVTATPALVGGIVAQPGSKLTYTLTVGNTGTSTAYEVEVTDTNPTANLRNITPVEGAALLPIGWKAGDPLVWTVPKVEVGKTVTLTYTAELAESKELENDDEVENAAEVPKYFGLPEPERKAAKESREYKGPKTAKDLEVGLPKIVVTKTTGAAGFPDIAPAEVGKAFPWRVVVKNESAVAGAKAVSVEDLLPAGWKYVKGTTTFKGVGAAVVVAPFDPAGETTETLTWANIAELPPTASVEVLFEAKPTLAALANAENENAAIGNFEDLSGSTESAEGPYEDEDEAFAELLSPELTITKTPDGGPTVAGSPAAYKILVENNGTGPAAEVEVEDVLSAGQKFVGPAVATPNTGFAQKSLAENTPGAGETTVVWTIASVPAGGEVEIEVPIETAASLNDGEEVTDLATVRSPQSPPVLPDEGSFKVTREADLEIEKTAVQPTVNAGEPIDYELKVTNNGFSDATGIVVTDQLPTSTVFVSSDPECAEAGGTITCEFPELKVGEAHTFHFEVEVKSGTTGFIENTAEVEGEQPDPEPGNNESTVETPIGGLANLSIVKTGPSAPVLLGNTFTYKLAVENKGPSDAVETEVEDALPTNVKFLSATSTVGTCEEAAAAILTCELGTLLPKATVTIEVTVEAAAVGAFMNKATVTSTTPDLQPGDNESEAPAEILPAADLTIAKTAPATVAPDGTLTYALHVENLGPSVAHHVVVTDPLPTGVDFVSASQGCAAAGLVVTCEVAGGQLAVGEAADFQITVHVPFALGGQSLSNTASVAAEEGDPHPENNTGTATSTVGPAADLSITKTMGKAEAGKPLTYTLAVTNHGPSASSAVTVKDTLPAGTTFKSAAPSQGTCSASGQEVTCQLGGLAASGSAQVSITVEVGVTVTGKLRNSAKVEGPEPDPDKGNNESAVEGPVTPAAPSAPNLKVVKTADTSSPTVGTPFHYDVAVSNLGGAEAKNVKVVDTLNGPVKIVSIDTEAGKCEAAGSTITCTIPSIAVGKTVHITYAVVAEAAGPLSNTASAQASNGEVAPSNNHAVKSVKAKAAKASYTLSKKASRKVVEGGEKVGFTITLRNGPTALVNATVCDRLPKALVFVKAAGAAFVKGEACWKKKYVAAHQVVKLHLTARAVKGGVARKARNVASATAANAPRRHAAATVRIKPVFSGAPGGVTG
jgi:large repetitive protein